MGGGVRYDPGGGSGSGPTTFADTLIGADQPFIVGDEWLPVFNPINSSTVGTILAGGVNRGGSGLTYQNQTGAGFLPLGFGIPYNYDLNAARGARQFVQFKVVTNPAGINRLAGVCYANLNLGSWYQMLIVSEAGQVALNRVNVGVVTNLIVQSAATAFVNNDVLKLTADALTTPGTTILKLFKNNVQIGATVNDNSGSRLDRGVCGLEFAGANPAVAITISDYLGGKL